jgi:phage gp36-like protein
MGDMVKDESVVDELRAIKAKERLTAADLARAADLAKSTMEGFLVGRHSMPLDKLERMLDVLGYKLIIQPK